ncbi:MAG TPA: hypothetical protein VGM80_01145 [Gaiellaceae bacterium]|jgi:hypothetical protein
MNRNHRLIAGTAAVALLAGGGAAFATMKLVQSHPAERSGAAATRVGIGRFGLGGRLGGRGFGGGLGASDDRQGAARRGFGFGFGSFGSGIEAAATYLGVTRAALDSDLGRGMTLAQVAVSKHKTVDGLVAAMVVPEQQRLAAAVSAGTLSSDNAERDVSLARQFVRAIVTGELPRLPEDGGNAAPPPQTGSGSTGSGSIGSSSA